MVAGSGTAAVVPGVGHLRLQTPNHLFQNRDAFHKHEPAAISPAGLTRPLFYRYAQTKNLYKTPQKI
jgi:hypothetical protein